MRIQFFSYFKYAGLLLCSALLLLACSKDDGGGNDPDNVYGKPHTYRFIINGGSYTNQEFKGEIENKYYDDGVNYGATGTYYYSEEVNFLSCIITDGQELHITATFLLSDNDSKIKPFGTHDQEYSKMSILFNNTGEADTELYESVSGTVDLKKLDIGQKGFGLAEAAYEVDFEGVFEGGLLMENEQESVQISGTIEINMPVQID